MLFDEVIGKAQVRYFGTLEAYARDVKDKRVWMPGKWKIIGGLYDNKRKPTKGMHVRTSHR